MSRRSLLGWVVALALLLSACSVDSTVTVKMREDGSGTVTVDATADPEAVQAAEVGGGTLEDRVRLSDLPAAGWNVSPWQHNVDGSASIALEKSFTSVDEVPGILRELSGPNGPLREARFTRSQSFFSTKYTARAGIDFGAATTGVTSDADLVARLQAQGVDVGGVDQQLLGQLRRGFTTRLVVELPGGTKVTATPEPGKPATLAASDSVQNTKRVTFVVVTALLVIAALLVALWPRRRGPDGAKRRRPHGVAGRA
jgi:hypothetical protein